MNIFCNIFPPKARPIMLSCTYVIKLYCAQHNPRYILRTFSRKAVVHSGVETYVLRLFVGVKLLVLLVQVAPQYAADYQDMIVQSLDHPDVSIQRKVHALPQPVNWMSSEHLP